jgi:hypothetical protein
VAGQTDDSDSLVARKLVREKEDYNYSRVSHLPLVRSIFFCATNLLNKATVAMPAANEARRGSLLSVMVKKNDGLFLVIFLPAFRFPGAEAVRCPDVETVSLSESVHRVNLNPRQTFDQKKSCDHEP